MAATRATGATAFLIKLNNLFFMTSSKLRHPQMHASGRLLRDFDFGPMKDVLHVA
jgi:hypothetical protein